MPWVQHFTAWLKAQAQRNAQKKHLFLPLALGAVVIVLAMAASFWMLEQRVVNIQQNHQSNNASVQHQAQQTLRPLPDAWESVIGEIYRNDTPTQTTTADIDTRPSYIKNARTLPLVPVDMPKIAIVIDDVGVNVSLSEEAESILPPEITFSYLPYGRATQALVQKGREKGREIMIHLPMEPMPRPEEPPINPGEDALYIDMTEEEIRQNVRKNLQDLKPFAVGVNNHMGSRFTANKEGMIYALDEINRAELFFLDSLTTHLSKVQEAAQTVAPTMPILVRDIFLDHYLTEDALINALVRLEDLAREKGHVIAIGHPHKRTTKVLAQWVKTLKHKGIALVPISHMLEHNKKKAPPLLPTTPITKGNHADGLYQERP